MAIGTTLKIGFDSNAVKTGLASIKGDFKGLANIGASIAKVGLAIAAAGAAAAVSFAAIVLKLNSIGEEARATDKNLKTGAKSMGLFGNNADQVTDRLIALADAQERLTGTDVFVQTQTLLMTFKDLAITADEVGGAFDRATIAAVDMAAKGFGTAEGNAVQLGKALSDPEKGLAALKKTGALTTQDIKRIGDEFERTGDKGKAFDDILSTIEKQTEGTAIATATASGRIKQSFNQIIEAFAIPFSEGFNGLPGALEGVFPRIIAAATKIGEIVGTAIAEAVAGDTEKLFAIGQLIGETLQAGFFAGANFLGHSTLKGMTGLVSGITDLPGVDRIPALSMIAKTADSMIPESNLGQDLRRELENSNAGIKARGLLQDFTSREMPGGTQITPNNMQLHDVKTLLNNIEKNTRTGSKL